MTESSGRPWAALGVASGTAFTTLYSVAAFSDPGYAFMDNYLSDLGVGPAALAFNSAVILAGIMMSLFAVKGLLPAFDGQDIVVRAGAGLLALSGLFLVLVGVFTEDSGDPHTLVSYAFFLTMLVTVGVVTVALHRERVLGAFGPAVSGSAFAVGVALLFAGFTPAAETVAVLVLLAWGVVLSAALYLTSRGVRMV